MWPQIAWFFVLKAWRMRRGIWYLQSRKFPRSSQMDSFLAIVKGKATSETSGQPPRIPKLLESYTPGPTPQDSPGFYQDYGFHFYARESWTKPVSATEVLQLHFDDGTSQVGQLVSLEKNQWAQLGVYTGQTTHTMESLLAARLLLGEKCVFSCPNSFSYRGSYFRGEGSQIFWFCFGSVGQGRKIDDFFSTVFGVYAGIFL